MAKLRFPAIDRLAKKALTKKVRQSIAYIHSQYSEIGRFVDVEDFIYELLERPTPTLSGIAHHLPIISRRITSCLWEAGIFISSSLVDQVIFVQLRGGSGEISVQEALAILRDTGLHRGGMVVYPLHSLVVPQFEIS